MSETRKTTDRLRLEKLAALYVYWRSLLSDPPLLVCAEPHLGERRWQLWLSGQHRKVEEAETLEELIDNLPNHMFRFSDRWGNRIIQDPLPCKCRVCTMTEEEIEQAHELRDARRQEAIDRGLVSADAFEDKTSVIEWLDGRMVDWGCARLLELMVDEYKLWLSEGRLGESRSLSFLGLTRRVMKRGRHV